MSHYAPEKPSLTAAEFRAVVSWIKQNRSAEIADFLEILAGTGVRPTQVEQMLWEHINFGTPILVPHERSDRTRARKIDADAASVVQRIIIGAHGRINLSARIFPAGIRVAANVAIGAACAHLGVKKFTSQDLRRFHEEHTGTLDSEPIRHILNARGVL